MITQFERYRLNESIFSKYNIGDYIIIETNPTVGILKKQLLPILNHDNDNRCKIIDKVSDINKIINMIGKYELTPYTIEFLDDTKEKITIEHIKRLMTTEEIEQFKLEKSANKYNL